MILNDMFLEQTESDLITEHLCENCCEPIYVGARVVGDYAGKWYCCEECFEEKHGLKEIEIEESKSEIHCENCGELLTEEYEAYSDINGNHYCTTECCYVNNDFKIEIVTGGN